MKCYLLFNPLARCGKCLEAVDTFSLSKYGDLVFCDTTEISNMQGFIDCVNQSGLSSLTLLQNCYVPGDDMQPVVLGIEYSRSIIKDGGVRVHGGGFAGSILAIVNDNEVSDYVDKMKKMFGSSSVFIASIREAGTTRVDL